MKDIIDSFTAKVSYAGSSLLVRIPMNTVKFAGIKKGDWLKLYFKKVIKEGEEKCQEKKKELEKGKDQCGLTHSQEI